MRLIAPLTVVRCRGVRLLEDSVACGVWQTGVTVHVLAIFSPLVDSNSTVSHCRALLLSGLLICFFVYNHHAILGLLALVCTLSERAFKIMELITNDATLREW